jgi:hypothetical protein
MSITGIEGYIPALFTKMSMPPKVETVLSIKFFTSFSTETSVFTYATLKPLLDSLSAASFPESLLSAITTFAPAPASLSAIPYPMPSPPPVTMAVLPEISRRSLFIDTQITIKDTYYINILF